MSIRPRAALIAAAFAAVAVGIGLPLALASSPDGRSDVPDRKTAAVTSLPGRVAPAGDTTLPGITTSRPAPGTVVQVGGPFVDRFRISSLRIGRGVVTGVLTVTSDVSEVIDLQVQVGFYDASGAFLGTATYEKHGEGARPDEVVRFTVAAPAGVRARVASAAMGVPVLVNE